jgi:single-strand DNA-binding protein
MNVVVLNGTVRAEPELVEVAGTTLCCFDLVCDSPIGRGGVPVRWELGEGRAPVAGERVMIVGEVRRRFFRSGSATASRTEVSPIDLAVQPTGRRTRSLLANALERLNAVGPTR